MAFKTKSPAKSVPAAPALKKVPLRIRAVGAKEVVLTGDFTQWAKDKVRLTPAAAGGAGSPCWSSLPASTSTG